MTCCRRYPTHCPHCTWNGHVIFGDLRVEEVKLPDGSFLMTELICPNCYRQVVSPFRDQPQFMPSTQEEDDALIEWGKKSKHSWQSHSADELILAMFKRQPPKVTPSELPIPYSDVTRHKEDVTNVQGENPKNKSTEDSISVVAMVLIAVLYAAYQIFQK